MSRHPYISYASGYYGIFDSNPDNLAEWRSYMKDISVARYTADSIVSGIGKELENASDRIGESIESASQGQVFAIDNLANEIGIHLNETNQELNFLNRKMDITIEQQKANLLLQHNIAELLKIPDSEKERQQSITLGLKFFMNAKKDPDLYKDALEEFLKAESLMKQDYFVLHRIGCIYLYCPDLMDINKALEYFIMAGKYATVDSSADSAKLANFLTNSINSEYTDTLSSEEQIGLLAADSFDKGALSAYILGDYNQAVELQKKAVSLNKSGRYHFYLAKYLFKAGNSDEACKQLDTAIEKDPIMMEASFLDKDIIQAPKTGNVLIRKRAEAENDIEEYLIKYINQSEPNTRYEKIASTISSSDYTHIRDVISDIEGKTKKTDNTFTQNPNSNIVSPTKDKHTKQETSYSVILKSAGLAKLSLVKIVKEIRGCGLKNAKEIVDEGYGSTIIQGISLDEAEQIAKKCTENGSSVEIIQN